MMQQSTTRGGGRRRTGEARCAGSAGAFVLEAGDGIRRVNGFGDFGHEEMESRFVF
jgi:hypothetical protein